MDGDVLPRRLGIVVGMAVEARILDGTGAGVAIGGGTPAGARRMAQQLMADGAAVLISFGLAGGLDPALVAGTLIAPRSVLWHGRRFDCAEALRALLPGTDIPCLLAAESVVALAADKRRLWQETAAGAVDLESGVVAEVAAAAGVPFAVLRAICDPAGRDLPGAAVNALDEQGRIAPVKVAKLLASNPGEIPGLIALGRDAARARRALVGGAECLGRLAAGHADLGGLGF